SWAPIETLSLWFVLRMWILLMAVWITVWLSDARRRRSAQDHVVRLCRKAESSHWMQSGRRMGTRAWLGSVALTAASYVCGVVWVDSSNPGRVYCVMGGALAWTPRTPRPSQWVTESWIWAPRKKWGFSAEGFLAQTTPFGGHVRYSHSVDITSGLGGCGLVLALLWGVKRVAVASSSGRRCTHCDYELIGTPAALPCPECGRPIEPSRTGSSEHAMELPPSNESPSATVGPSSRRPMQRRRR
ncbi:MAG: hypothetical protein ACOYN0_17350, partial [Phycisphaerales bacterium]